MSVRCTKSEQAWRTSLSVASVVRVMAQVRCNWTQGWTEIRGRRYGLMEAQVQVYLNKPGPDYGCDAQALWRFP